MSKFVATPARKPDIIVTRTELSQWLEKYMTEKYGDIYPPGTRALMTLQATGEESILIHINEDPYRAAVAPKKSVP